MLKRVKKEGRKKKCKNKVHVMLNVFPRARKKKRSLNRTYLSGEFNILGLDLNG